MATRQMTHAEMQALALQDPRAFVELLEGNNVGKVKARLAANRSNPGAVAPIERPRIDLTGESAARPHNQRAQVNRPEGGHGSVPSGPALALYPFLIAIALGIVCWVLIAALVAFIVRRILGS
jgi:hypothetical protein